MYISGNSADFETRLHSLATGDIDLSLYILEVSGYLTGVSLQQSGKWEKEAQLIRFQFTMAGGALVSGLIASPIPASAPNVSNVSGFGSGATVSVTVTNTGLYTAGWKMAVEESVNGSGFNPCLTLVHPYATGTYLSIGVSGSTVICRARYVSPSGASSVYGGYATGILAF